MPQDVGNFQARTRVAQSPGSVRARAWSLERTSVLTELELSPYPSFIPSPHCSPPRPAKLLAIVVGGPGRLLSRGGAGQEEAVNLRVPPYLWEKAGKIQVKAEGSRGGQGAIRGDPVSAE